MICKHAVSAIAAGAASKCFAAERQNLEIGRIHSGQFEFNEKGSHKSEAFAGNNPRARSAKLRVAEKCDPFDL